MTKPRLAQSRDTTVLICDDTLEIRSVLRSIVELAPAAHVVGEAADGRLAIEEAQRLQPDLILLDLAMPIVSGLDALPAIRRAAPGATILVFSGFAAEIMEKKVLDLGADAYLEKGAAVTTILTMIEGVVPVVASASA